MLWCHQERLRGRPRGLTATRNDRPVRLVSAGGLETEILVGDGYYRLSNKDEKVPAVFLRRTAASTLYGNVLDISGTKDGYVKTVTQEGGLEAGYGLLKVETIKGTDVCFAAYRPGNYKTGDLETDAQQALVLTDGQAVRAMYLAGGKTLQAGGAALERSEPGLAFVERTPLCSYIVANPSPSAATVTVTLPSLAGLEAFILDAKGQRTGAAKVATGSAAGSFVIALTAASKVEFVRK